MIEPPLLNILAMYGAKPKYEVSWYLSKTYVLLELFTRNIVIVYKNTWNENKKNKMAAHYHVHITIIYDEALHFY